MKRIIAGLLIILGIYTIYIIIKDYNQRITEYNYHMCVEVYGKDENCN